ncbi:MAG: hypothetical protein OES10_14770 [Gammaproteobacteria bacterium]|nr:hypothetical protein [Gammaproteobacteria bacterium]MDH3750564.1 hypothetical protein [Gammaproteobacteria bacterium]
MSASSDGHYKVYEEHMKTLRAWFVAYGVGGPVLFITQKDFAASLVDSGLSKLVGVLFLIGVLLQALVALFNKWVNWGLYFYDDDEDNPGDSSEEEAAPRRLQKFCENYSSKVWVDIAADIATLILFSVATIIVLMEVSRGAGAG